MSACEKCWGDAYRLFRVTGKNQSECYHALIENRNKMNKLCTPKEQAGQFWNEEKQIDYRNIQEE